MAKTANIDSTTADSTATYYAPQYADGFPARHGADSTAIGAADSVSSLDTCATLELPHGVGATHAVASPLHDGASMALMLAAAFFLVTSYRTGYKYIENLPVYLFSVKRRDSLFDDHTVSETRIMLAMLGLTWVMEGLLLYYAIPLSVPALAPGLQQSVFLHVLLFTGLAALFHVLQLLFYRLLGWVFADPVDTGLWIAGFNASQACLGVILLPVVIVTLVAPEQANSTLFCAVILYFLARIVFILKGFRIFFNNFSSTVYFLLYLCSAEVVPPLSFYTGTVLACNMI